MIPAEDEFPMCHDVLGCWHRLNLRAVPGQVRCGVGLPTHPISYYSFGYEAWPSSKVEHRWNWNPCPVLVCDVQCRYLSDPESLILFVGSSFAQEDPGVGRPATCLLGSQPSEKMQVHP